MRPILKQIAELIGGAIRDLRASFEPRLKALENRPDPASLIDGLRRELQESKESLKKGVETTLRVEMDTKELQKLLETTAAEIRTSFDQAQEKLRAQFDQSVKTFHDAALARESLQNELTGELRAILAGRAELPPLDQVVRSVAQEIREADTALATRCTESAFAVAKEWRSEFAGRLTSLADALAAIPSVDAVAKAAAALVPVPVMPVIPAPPDLSGFATSKDIGELANELHGRVDTFAEKLKDIPSVDAVAKAAAALVPAPAPSVQVVHTPPDLSGLATTEQLTELATSLGKMVGELPSVDAVAKAAAALVPVPVMPVIPAPPDLSGFATNESVAKLATQLDEKISSATPSVDAVAKAAAALVPVPVMPTIPALPDLSGFMKADQVQEMIAADREKSTATPLDPADVARKAVELLPQPLKLEDVAKAAAALVPAPKDGVAPTVTEIVEAMAPNVSHAVELHLRTASEAMQGVLSAALSQIPIPKDGKSFTLDEVQSLIAQAMKGMHMPTAEEVADSLNNTHVTKWALDFERRAQDLLQKTADRIPIPKDGLDGLGFEDLNVEFDGVRTFTFVMVRGTQRKEFAFKVPVMIHRGVYNDSMIYDKGDVTTWGGSSWLALKDLPQGKPGVGATHDWQLIVKKGRDASGK